MEQEVDLSILKKGIPCDPLPQWDPEAPLDQSVPHAPPRPAKLDPEEKKVSKKALHSHCLKANLKRIVLKPEARSSQRVAADPT